MTRVLQSLKWIWRKVPFREVILLVAILLLIGENYPFSNFPMYSSLSPRAELVYVTDGAGNVLSLQPIFGFDTWSCRKMLKTETHRLEKIQPSLSKEAIREQAGQFVLAFLMTQLPADQLAESPPKRFLLHWDKLELVKGKLVKQTLPPIALKEFVE